MHSQPPIPYSERFAAELRRRGVEAHHLNSIAAAPAAIEELAQIIRAMLHDNNDTFAPHETITVEDVSIADTDIDVRVMNALAFAGVDSLCVLSLLSKRQVYIIPRIGQKMLQEIEDLLQRHGLSFRDELIETIAQKANRIESPSEHVQEFLANLAQDA